MLLACAAIGLTGCPDGPATTTETGTATETGSTGTTSEMLTTGSPETGSTSTGSDDSTGSTSTGSVDPTTGGTSTGDTSTGDTSTGDTSTGDTSTGDTSTGDTSTGDTSTGDTSTGEPVKPDDCEDLPIGGIELVSQQQHAFDTAGPVPLVRTPEAVANITGDGALFDLVRILFDGDVGVGVHALDPDPNHAIPAFVKTFVTVSNAAVVYQEDLDGMAYKKRYIAVAGELELSDLVTPHQTAGVVRNVELREIATNADTGELELVDGGGCFWIDEHAFDVRRPNGCAPYTEGACPEGQFCMPVNAIGTDGECVATAAKQEGETCERESATTWDSDCAPGLRCIDVDAGFTCMKVCDVLSDAPDCPAGTHCGGGYNLCLDESVLQMSGIVDAEVGEVCDAPAFYCGGAGRPGMCYDDDAEGPMPAMCRAFATAPSQCEAPKTAGYVAYKGGIDRSTLWCLTP